MVTCPRCEQPVDETVRTTCPLCFTPLTPQPAAAPPANAPQPMPGAAPVMPPMGAQPGYAPTTPPAPGYTPQMPPAQPGYAPQQPGYAPQQPMGAQPLGGANAYPQAAPLGGQPAPSGIPGIPNVAPPPMAPGVPMGGMGGGQTRTTLSGEVIQMPNVGSQMGGGSAIPQMSSPGSRLNNPSSPRRMESVPQKSGASGSAVAVLVLLLVAAGAFGGWYLFAHRGSPKAVVEQFVVALKAQDIKTIYGLSEHGPNDPSAEDQQKQFDKVKDNPFFSMIFDAMKKATYTVGDETVTGDTATVPLDVKVEMGGQSADQKLELKLTKVDGQWKLSKDNKNLMGGGAGGMGGSSGGGFGGKMGGGMGGGSL